MSHAARPIAAFSSHRRARPWLAGLTTATLTLGAAVGTSLPAAAAPAPAPAPSIPTVPEAFTLHSYPGAEYTIFLDFDGATVNPELWTKYIPDELPGWSPAADGSSWGPDELAFVEDAWAMLADRFSPWVVDVTTEDPGPEARGGHIVVTPYAPWVEESFAANIAGSEFGGTLDLSTNKPSLLFADGMWDARTIANIGAHETGHTFGVLHASGTPTYGDDHDVEEYFQGEMVDIWKVIANWTPIMGGSNANVAQWSRGDFPGATVTQDALAQISTYLELREDEAPSGSADAVPLPTVPAYVTSEDDIDSWTLGTCLAGSTVTVTPVVEYSSLDVAIALVRRGETTPILSANPPSYSAYDMSDPEYHEHFYGLDASLTVPDDGADYVLQVRGGGNGYWETGGYGPYGSIGGYTIEIDGCDGVNAGSAPAAAQPGAPWALESAFTELSGDEVRILWSEPWGAGASPITEYVISRQAYSTVTGQASGPLTEVATATADGTRAIVTDQPTGTYVFHVQAGSDEGLSQSATTGPFGFGPEVELAAPVIEAASNRVGEVVSIAPLAITPADANVEYQWRHRAATRSGTATEWLDIPGATGATYQLTTGDLGKELSVLVTASKAGRRSATASSLASAPVVAADAADYSEPFGEPTVGRFRVRDYDPDLGLYNRPRDLAIDAAGYVYVPADLDGVEGNERIQKFSPSGDLIATWDVAPAGKWRTSIVSVDVGPDGYIRVFDVNHRQIHVYSAEGALRHTWEVPMPYRDMVVLDRQTWISVDGDGRTYVADPTYGKVSRFDLDGTRTGLWDVTADRDRRDFEGSIAGVRAVTVDGETTLYYVHPEGGEIRALDEDGTIIGNWPLGGLTGSSDLTVGPDGDFYVLVRTGLGGGETPATWVRHFTPDFDLADEYRVWGIDVTGVEIGAAGQLYVAKNQFDVEIQMIALDGYPYGVPSAPTVTATPGNNMVIVEWTPPTNRPDFPLDAERPYTVSLGDQTYDTSGTWAQFYGLTSGVEYTARVVANNLSGASAPGTATVTPYGAPVAPTNVKVVAGDAQATVSWDAAVDHGLAVTSYTVTTWPATSTVVVEDGLSAVVTDLTNGQYYMFFVAATNEAGTSGPGIAGGTPSGIVSAPPSLVANPYPWSVELTWGLPTGGVVTHYTVTATGGGETFTGTTDQRFYPFEELTSGTKYTFTVVAENGAGKSAAATATATAHGEPSAPTGLKAVTGDGHVTLSWKASAANGSDIRHYRISTIPVTYDRIVFGLGAVVDGLTNGTTYTFKVAAENEHGWSAVAEISAKPAAPPFTKTSTPTVSGTKRVGQTLTANVAAWTPAASFTYQWYRGSSKISGATGKTYLLQPADLGKSISVEVTGSKDGYATKSVKSADGTVATGTFTAKPTISGTTKVGSALTAVAGTWAPKATFKYQWYRGTAAIAKATGKTYVLQPADLGKSISVKVTGSAAGYTSKTVASAGKKITAGTLTAATPTITGTLKAGSTLTAKPGTWKAGTSTKVTFKYQWLVAGKAVAGATKSTWKVPTSAKGKKVTVKVTGSATGYTAQAKTSAAKTIAK